MGLSVQSVGVEASRLPREVAAAAAPDPAELPRIPGWTWISLAEAVDEAALDALVTHLAAQSNTRALAVSIDDSDTAYLVGAAPASGLFRLRVNPEFEEVQDVETAAAFAGIAAEPLVAALAQTYVYAEQGVRLLMAEMGLLPPARQTPLLASTQADVDDEPEEAADLIAAIRKNRDGRRWVASAGIEFPGRWIVVAAERESGGIAASFCSRSDRIEIETAYPTISALQRDLTLPEAGIDLGDWHEVPADVPRSFSATTRWGLRTIKDKA